MAFEKIKWSDKSNKKIEEEELKTRFRLERQLHIVINYIKMTLIIRRGQEKSDTSKCEIKNNVHVSTIRAHDPLSLLILNISIKIKVTHLYKGFRLKLLIVIFHLLSPSYPDVYNIFF